ncbi:hypothetical protein RCH19_000809 [Flavobacterium sp. PL12]
MIPARFSFTFIFLMIVFLNQRSMAQNTIVIEDNSAIQNCIQIENEAAKPSAEILKKYLDQSFLNPFLVETESLNSNATIHLSITNPKNKKEENSFTIKSDNKDIFLEASNEKFLRYAVYTLLEQWGFRKFTATAFYYPKLNELTYPKNSVKTYRPSFDYRALYYPDAFDSDFREWHKLDWHPNDFSVWGHSFNTLLPAKDYFKSNPEYFAFSDGERRSESLCMTSDNALALIVKKMGKLIAENPNASFISVSQNDESIYCECDGCKLQNKKHGGPQGSLYYFLNKISRYFPQTKIATLAYQHTFSSPINLKIEPNIYTFLCPIELNRGKAIEKENSNEAFLKTIKEWQKVTANLYLWDYTVQFSNYLSPFPNIHTFSDNYKFFQENNIKGLFVQGYADVPGDFSELRQYLLSKLLWDDNVDINKTTADFLKGFYGSGEPFIAEYLNQLTQNQEQSNRTLDIYSGPIQKRNTLLSAVAMHQYDILIDKAAAAVREDATLSLRVKKLRLALEFVYFEQSKFYGLEKHGMFDLDKDGQKVVKEGLTERVKDFAKTCTELGIYELSEEGISPNTYYENWLAISKSVVHHLGEKLEVKYLSNPSPDYSGKGNYTLVNGIKGHNDHNINWTGWYGNNPEIEIISNGLDFNCLKINFLDNQRNWIFTPKSLKVFGYIENNWVLIKEVKASALVENYEVKSIQIVVSDSKLSGLEKIKIVVENQDDLPSWRYRKNKKPMVMIDEIEFYKN